MALEAERGADALIRQVQKVLGKASPAAAPSVARGAIRVTGTPGSSACCRSR